MKKRQKKTKGFTLVEMMVTVGLVGLLSGLAMWQMGSGKADRDNNAAVRDVTNMLRTARTTGRSRAEVGNFAGAPAVPSPSGPSGPSAPSGAPPPPLPGASVNQVTVRTTTVDAIGPSQLRLTAQFSDGTSRQLEVIDLASKYPGTGLRFTNPAAISFTFNADGSRTTSGSNSLTMVDHSGKSRTLEVSLSGKASLK